MAPWPLVVSSHEMYRTIFSDRIWGFPDVLQNCLSLQPILPSHSDLPNPVSLTSPKCNLYICKLARWFDSVTANLVYWLVQLKGSSFFGCFISGIIFLCWLLSNVWKMLVIFCLLSSCSTQKVFCYFMLARGQSSSLIQHVDFNWLVEHIARGPKRQT